MLNDDEEEGFIEVGIEPLEAVIAQMEEARAVDRKQQKTRMMGVYRVFTRFLTFFQAIQAVTFDPLRALRGTDCAGDANRGKS